MSKQKFKLTIMDVISYEEMKTVLDNFDDMGYKISFVDNGNILIEEKEVEK